MKFREKSVGSDDLEKLKNQIQHASESDALDFKKEIEESKKGQADFIKDVASFANLGGGMMIYGVDGKNRVGVLESEHSKYDVAGLHNKIKDHLSPVPKMEIEFIETQGKKFPTLFISGGDESVVLISKNLHDHEGKQILRAGEIYLRQNTQSLVVSNDATMRKILDSVVERKVKRQLEIKDAILTQFLRVIGSDKNEAPTLPTQTISWRSLAREHLGLTENSPSFVIELSPSSQESFSKENLTKAFGLVASNGSESYPMLGIFHNSCKIQRVNDGFVAFSKIGNDWKAITVFNFNGSMTSQFSLIEDCFGENPNGIKIPAAIRRFTLILDHSFKYISCLESGNDWMLKINVVGIKGRKLLPGLNFFPLESKISLEEKFEYKIKISQGVSGQIITLVKEVSNKLFNLFSHTVGVGIEQTIEESQRKIQYDNTSIFFPTSISD